MKKIIFSAVLISFSFSAFGSGVKIKSLSEEINQSLQSYSGYSNLSSSKKRLLIRSLRDLKEQVDDLSIGNNVTNLFCSGSTLFKGKTKIVDVRFDSNCKESLNQAKANNGNFCADSKFYNLNVGKIVDVKFDSSCNSAVRQANRYNGNFCADSVLYNVKSGKIRDLRFNSDCEKALKNL